MEIHSPDEKLDSLLRELEPVTSLSDEDVLALHDLSAELEAEFGDLDANLEQIRDEFLRLYKTMPDDIPLREPLSDSDPERFYDRKYFGNRDYFNLIGLFEKQPQILRWWSDYFANVILPSLFQQDENYEIQNGGIKTLASVRERINARSSDGRPQDFEFLRDIMRGRVVGKTLKDVEKAIQRLRENSESCLVHAINYYHSLPVDWRGDHSARPYFAAHFTLKIDDDLAYELQIMTERAARIGQLDHPVRVKKEVTLSPEKKRYLDALVWGSHLMDYREYFQG